MRLVYLTESYPFGLGEEWKTNELAELRFHFSEIVVIPYHYGGNKTPLNLPWSNVDYREPLYSGPIAASWLKLIWMIFEYPYIFIPELLLAMKARILGLSLLKRVASNVYDLLRSEVLIVELNKKNTIAYFFWGRKTVEVMACGFKHIEYAVRYHNYDLLKERYPNGYVPLQRRIMNKASRILAISDLTKTYIRDKWKIDELKIRVSRLGTLSKGLAEMGGNEKLVIVSCSSIIGIKRLDRIIEVLKAFPDVNIHWTHIGGGPLMKEITELAHKNLPSVRINFVGQVEPADVKSYYVNQEVDLFLNMSDFEGVPVSIMEAMSAGIPVIAPNIGGISEIVNSDNGFLLKPDFIVEDAILALKTYKDYPEGRKKEMRMHALEMFSSKYDASKNAEELAGHLKAMTH